MGLWLRTGPTTISWSKNWYTAKLGHWTHNRQHWSEARTRGTSTGDPYPYHYTNVLLAESTIQTVYNRNTRRLTIKIYAGIVTLAFAREPNAKAKKCNGHDRDWTYSLACARRARHRCINRNLLKWPQIYDLDDETVNLLVCFKWQAW